MNLSSQRMRDAPPFVLGELMSEEGRMSLGGDLGLGGMSLAEEHVSR